MLLGPFVDTAWLAAHREQVLLADVRWYLDGQSGQAAYDVGHLAGAVFVDVDTDLSVHDRPQDGRHPLPSPEQFARAMSSLGIGDDTVVVAYDDAGGVTAARLVWMLRSTGHAATLLDGGMGAGPLSVDHPVAGPTVFTASPWPALASLNDVTAPEAVVLDARPRERFRGDGPDPVDPRAGHVPGARNVPCRENLDAAGRLLPVEVLRERFRTAGAVPGADVVSSCGSGVTACHTLLALEHAGLGPARLFPGSWSQYSRTDLPAETGPGPVDTTWPA